MQAAMVCNCWKELRTVIMYARMSLGSFIYTWASMNYFSISLLRKQVSPCLLRGSLAYTFSGLLIPTKTIHRLSISDVRMLLLTGRITKVKTVRSFFLQDRRNSRHVFKLGKLARSENSPMHVAFFRSEY